jgi:endonuclease YncB( thermonuclease family)
VWLEYDPRQRGPDRRGRDRAHVWLSDGTLLGWLLLREGYARVPDYPAPHRYEAAYRHAQELARAEGRGGWRACSW